MNKGSRHWSNVFWTGALSVLLMSGCNKKLVKPTTEEVEVEKQEKAEASDADKPFTIESILGQEWKDIPQLANVQFALDQAGLTGEARAILQRNAQFLKQYPQIEVRVGGHCDDRGTTEYNIALGQRRARNVRDYYKALGLRENRLSTISFGEERPLCSDETEECWSKNRRAETRVRAVSVESKPSGKSESRREKGKKN